MDNTNLDTAIEALRAREETAIGNIGYWSTGEEAPSDIPDLSGWVTSRSIEAVIWTALGPRFNGTEGKALTVEEAERWS